MSDRTQHLMPDGRPAPAILTKEELAEFCRFSGRNITKTLRRYRQSGQLVATRFGRDLHYRLEDVLDFLERQRGK